MTERRGKRADSLRGLHQLARFNGVQTAYHDVNNRRRQASPEALSAALRAMGVELNSPADAQTVFERQQQRQADRGIEPVTVAWTGQATHFALTLPAQHAETSAVLTLYLENGDVRRTDHALNRCPTLEEREIQGRRYVAKSLKLPDDLPGGYHRLAVEARAGRFESMLVAAPRRAYSPAKDDPAARSWGGFLPLYAVQSQHSLGAGDFGDLQRLMDWTASRGGRLVGTLPLLPTYLNQPFDPSPYAPVSRTFWNEFYIDLQQLPEFAHSTQAQDVLNSPSAAQTIRAARESEGVEYRGLMALKRQVLTVLAERFFREQPPRFAQFQRFLQENPQLHDYARFRAVQEQQQTPWSEWPGRLRNGTLEAGDCDPQAEQYYLYAQWSAGEQLQHIANRAEQAGTGLYLDLPLGTRPDGYDVWRHRQAFVAEATAGAPPDAVFTKGQDWGFSPLHPQGIREQHYGHVIDVIRHHLAFARFLRIDHVMGLHRLYWIPRGMPANRGVYVQYRPEEMYAVLSLESHRSRAVVVGENLGTVPGHVNRALSRHHIRRMYVVQYELQTDGGEPVLAAVPRGSVASLNTHDMPPFAAWWRGDDIPDRMSLGLLDDHEAQAERQTRSALKRRLAAWLHQSGWLKSAEADAAAVIPACLQHLAAAPAEMVLVNLEDLWLEAQPHNVPGTNDERPNWRRKARYTFEEFTNLPSVVETLETINRLRQGHSF